MGENVGQAGRGQVMPAILMGWWGVGQRQYHHNLHHGRGMWGYWKPYFLLLGKELRNSSVTVKYQ